MNERLYEPKCVRVADFAIMAILFLGAIGLYSLTWFDGLTNGISTVGGESVLVGKIPHRDFWTLYAPGSFYLLALMFQLFGTHLLVEVVSASVLCAVATCVCYLLALRLQAGRIAAAGCAAIFVAATYNTVYFQTLDTYPPTILFILVALNLVALHYQAGRLSDLGLAGLATGAIILFKHDVGGYTAIAIIAGLAVNQLLRLKEEGTKKISPLGLKLGIYCAGSAIIVLPVLLYLIMMGAGPAMWENMIVFPATDFRFSRPEVYPSLIPSGIYDAWRVKMLVNLFHYLNYALPFLFFLLGVLATGQAVRERKPALAAFGVTFSLAYFLHYVAAHVQINTHIISMSVYGALAGLLFLVVIVRQRARKSTVVAGRLVWSLAAVWLLSLALSPSLYTVYNWWAEVHPARTELELPKVSGISVPPEQARDLRMLSSFVDRHTSPGEKIFIGLHRHDVVITGDPMLYFILDRRSATGYYELHPAIADTARVQDEIIRDLENETVSLIVLKHNLPDEDLERLKQQFLRNLPNVGATGLDVFIRENYAEMRRFGPYEVWRRKGAISSNGAVRHDIALRVEPLDVGVNEQR